jgi:hypothetical protein
MAYGGSRENPQRNGGAELQEGAKQDSGGTRLEKGGNGFRRLARTRKERLAAKDGDRDKSGKEQCQEDGCDRTKGRPGMAQAPGRVGILGGHVRISIFVLI